jgi:hypothetical protein
MLDPRQELADQTDELKEDLLDAPEWEVWEEEDRDAGVEEQPSRQARGRVVA